MGTKKASHITFDEHKIYILSIDNQVRSYGVSPGANIQPLVDFYKKDVKLPIAEIYLQRKENEPMEVVTALYDIV